MTESKRTVCSTVKTIFPLVNILDEIEIKTLFHTGEKIIENVLGTGVDFIATSDMYYVLEDYENE